MIGLIVTGHGDYALGLRHGIEMIAGTQHAFEVVPFYESDSIEKHYQRMVQSIEQLQREADGVVIYTDLEGGTPYEGAIMAASAYENVSVVVGVNLPMLMEVTIAREFAKNPLEIALPSVKAGKDSMTVKDRMSYAG